MNPMFTDIIGENVKIIKSKDPTLIGIEGKVVNETKNMITILNNKEIRVPKRVVFLEINGKIYDMSRYAYRPEEKIRKMRRKGII